MLIHRKAATPHSHAPPRYVFQFLLRLCALSVPPEENKKIVERLSVTHSRRSDGAPEPDGALREAARKKNRHYRQLYINSPDP